MTDEQLYIDGQLVDINDGTNITLSIASNLFRDIAKMISNTRMSITKRVISVAVWN